MPSRPATIVHFALRGAYSAPFLGAAADFERRTGVPIVPVFRAPQRSRDLARRAARTVRRALRRTPGATRRRGAVLEPPSTDSDGFRARIAPGANGIITGFNEILRSATLDRFASIVNFHPSLLPYYRGSRPIGAALANGEPISGHTVHRVTAAIDAGPIVWRERVAIAGLRTEAEVMARIHAAQIPVFVAYLEHLAFGTEFGPHVESADGYRVAVDMTRSSPTD